MMPDNKEENKTLTWYKNNIEKSSVAERMILLDSTEYKLNCIKNKIKKILLVHKYYEKWKSLNPHVSYNINNDRKAYKKLLINFLIFFITEE